MKKLALLLAVMVGFVGVRAQSSGSAGTPLQGTAPDADE
jgi:hypothetical protein